MQNVKRSAIIIILLLFAVNLLALPAAQEAELKNIVFQKKGNELEVKIEYPADTPYDSFSLMNPNRLVLDFMGIRTVSSVPMIEINEMGIVSIRSALNRPGVARVVFNFEEKAPLYRIEKRENALLILFWEEKTESDKMESVGQEIKTEKLAEPAPKKETVSQPKTEKISKPDMTAPLPEKGGTASTKTAKKKMAVGFSGGYSVFQDEAFKEAYGQGGVFFKGEFSLYFPGNIENLDIWTGMTYFKKSGKMSITEEDIQLQMTTFSLAIRYLKSLSRFTPFAGVGIDYIVYEETLPEDFMLNSVGGSDLGFHVQAGVYYDILPQLSLKAHIRYLWSKTTENDIDINLGGVEYGVGLIFRFSL